MGTARKKGGTVPDSHPEASSFFGDRREEVNDCSISRIGPGPLAYPCLNPQLAELKENIHLRFN
jgi:hypothetical protein